MKLVLGEDYPACPPKGYFITKIFHPNGIYLPLELHLSPPPQCPRRARSASTPSRRTGLRRFVSLACLTPSACSADHPQARVPGDSLFADRALPRVESQRRGGEALHGELRGVLPTGQNHDAGARQRQGEPGLHEGGVYRQLRRRAQGEGSPQFEEEESQATLRPALGSRRNCITWLR